MGQEKRTEKKTDLSLQAIENNKIQLFSDPFFSQKKGLSVVDIDETARVLAVVNQTELFKKLKKFKYSIVEKQKQLNDFLSEQDYVAAFKPGEATQKVAHDAAVTAAKSELEVLKSFLRETRDAIKKLRDSLKKLGPVTIGDWQRMPANANAVEALKNWHRQEWVSIPSRLYHASREPLVRKKRRLAITGRILMVLSVLALAAVIALMVAFPALLPMTALVMGLGLGLPILTGIIGGGLLYRGWDPEGRELSKQDRSELFQAWCKSNEDVIRSARHELTQKAVVESESLSRSPLKGILKTEKTRKKVAFNLPGSDGSAEESDDSAEETVAAPRESTTQATVSVENPLSDTSSQDKGSARP